MLVAILINYMFMIFLKKRYNISGIPVKNQTCRDTFQKIKDISNCIFVRKNFLAEVLLIHAEKWICKKE